MARTYKPVRKAKRRVKIEPGNLKLAIRAVVYSQLSIRKAAAHFGLKRSMLANHIKNPLKRSNSGEETEKRNVENLIICGHWGFPMRPLELRLIVRDYLERTEINTRIIELRKNMPGPDFIQSFLKRNNSLLSLRLCSIIKSSRAGVNGQTNNTYFDNYKRL